MCGAAVCFWQGKKDKGSGDRAGGKGEGQRGEYRSICNREGGHHKKVNDLQWFADDSWLHHCTKHKQHVVTMYALQMR